MRRRRNRIREVYVATLIVGVLSLVGVQEELLSKTLSSALVEEGSSRLTTDSLVTDSLSISEVTDSLTVLDTTDHLAGLIEELQHSPTRMRPLPPERLRTLDMETLWLARGIFSESKRPNEQELVAWVIRNRVDTSYRGKRTYRDVVLDPYQFSAFNPESRMRTFYANLGPHSKVPGWHNALTIAYNVRYAKGDDLRPFSMHTRHFYSERSMVGRLSPDWAEGLRPITPTRYTIDRRRFQFYEGVS